MTGGPPDASTYAAAFRRFAAQYFFIRRLTALRKAFPVLHRSRFLVGAYNEELDVKDVTWLAPSGEEMTIEQWQDPNSRCLGMLLDGRAQATGIKRRGSDATLLMIYNAGHQEVGFVLPAVAEGRSWIGLVDTSAPEQETKEYAFEHPLTVASRSFQMLVLSSTVAGTGLRHGLDAILYVAGTPLTG